MKPKIAAPKVSKQRVEPVSAEPCPCGSGKPYPVCCGQYLSGAQAAPTAQALMRSRYTAFARGDFEYVLRTWAARTRPPSVDLRSAGSIVWTGLEVVACRAGGRSAKEGQVEFIAHCAINGHAQQLHEVSRFVREAGQWVYVEGEIKQARLETEADD
ncbi:MAG: YchJ family protein [Gammaproteobacteria bacterium]